MVSMVKSTPGSRAHRYVASLPWWPGTQHDGTWYGIPSSGWPGWGWVSPPGCAPSWILVKINPFLAKPRTLPKSSWRVDASQRQGGNAERTLERAAENEEQITHRSRQPVKLRFKLLFSQDFAHTKKNGESSRCLWFRSPCNAFGATGRGL